jgi:hypothetical protein
VARHGSKLTFDKTDLDHFPPRIFLYFQKKNMGQKRRIGDELEVLKTRKMILVVFPAFLSAK